MNFFSFNYKIIIINLFSKIFFQYFIYMMTLNINMFGAIHLTRDILALVVGHGSGKSLVWGSSLLNKLSLYLFTWFRQHLYICAPYNLVWTTFVAIQVIILDGILGPRQKIPLLILNT